MEKWQKIRIKQLKQNQKDRELYEQQERKETIKLIKETINELQEEIKCMKEQIKLKKQYIKRLKKGK